MSWLRVDDKFPRHPKIEPLSDQAFRLHFHALAHCAEHETDGFLSEQKAISLTTHRNKAALIKELEGAKGHRQDGNPLWVKVAGGWKLHDFLKYNASHEEQEAKRKAARDRMASARSHSVRANVPRTSQETDENRMRTSRHPDSNESRTLARVCVRGTGIGSESVDPEGSAEGNRTPESAAAEAVDSADVPSPETGFDLALRVWSELWGKAYRAVYDLPLDHGSGGDERTLQRLGAMAQERGDRAEAVLRYKAKTYLANAEAFYANKRHPLRFLEKDWNSWGEPATPQAPRLAGAALPPAPEPPRLTPEQRTAAAKALMSGLATRGVAPTSETRISTKPEGAAERE